MVNWCEEHFWSDDAVKGALGNVNHTSCGLKYRFCEHCFPDIICVPVDISGQKSVGKTITGAAACTSRNGQKTPGTMQPHVQTLHPSRLSNVSEVSEEFDDEPEVQPGHRKDLIESAAKNLVATDLDSFS